MKLNDKNDVDSIVKQLIILNADLISKCIGAEFMSHQKFIPIERKNDIDLVPINMTSGELQQFVINYFQNHIADLQYKIMNPNSVKYTLQWDRHKNNKEK